MNLEMNLEITWLYDEYTCESCGYTRSMGAEVTLNGEPLLELKPVAHCFDPWDWDEATVFKEILQKLGYEVKERNI